MDCGGKAECVATAAIATETHEGRTPSEPAYESNLARLLKAVNAGESGNRETQGGTNTGEFTSQNGSGRYSRRAPAHLRIHALNRSVGGEGCVSEARACTSSTMSKGARDFAFTLTKWLLLAV